MKVLFFIGFPGVGKDTQARLLESEHPMVRRFSVGELMRGESDPPNDRVRLLVRQFQEAKGREEIRDGYAFDAVMEIITFCHNENRIPVITGFPRTGGQVTRLRSVFRDRDLFFLHLVAPDETLNDRLHSRADQKRRAGIRLKASESDQAGIYEKRQRYRLTFEPMLQQLKDNSLVQEIDATGSHASVREAVEDVLMKSSLGPELSVRSEEMETAGFRQ